MRGRGHEHRIRPRVISIVEAEVTSIAYGLASSASSKPGTNAAIQQHFPTNGIFLPS